MSNNSENENEKEQTRVSVRIGKFQVEVEGDYKNLKALMDEEVLAFIGKLQKALGDSQNMISPEVTTEDTKDEEIIPPLGRPSSTSDALSKLFDTEWGSKPRQLSDVMNALEANGVYYKKPVVAKVLVDLIKKKELRRLGSRGSYQYVKA
ncbi:MAG: hypothetical protein NWF06_00870 [Candidatus Bathyarchaeota archaeon]|nr:hypothetical protein [Candidatus Bathyarchaeum sp.]